MSDVYEDEHDDLEGEDDYDPGEDCGRWNNGRLGSYYHCRLAGTEFCDFECPFGYTARAAAKVKAEGK